MGRGLAILGIFAVLIGAYVYCGPMELSITPRRPAAGQREVTAETATETNKSTASVAPVRKTESTPDEAKRRDSVLVVTPAVATSALGALPEKAIPGFPPAPQKSFSHDQLASVMKQAKQLRASGHLMEARDLLSDAYLANRLTKDQRLRLADELEPLAWEVLRSRNILDHGQLYEVGSGDLLGKISKRLQVSPEFIVKLNDLKSAKSIRPRQMLKLVNGPFDVLVELSEFELTVLHFGAFVCRYTVGIGREESPTPVGLYKVNTKLIDPVYFGAGAPPVPAKARENPLGSRWIDIGLGYGIHGTYEPETIGQRSSRGCVRLTNEDVEELYDMLTEGSRVLIR